LILGIEIAGFDCAGGAWEEGEDGNDTLDDEARGAGVTGLDEIVFGDEGRGGDKANGSASMRLADEGDLKV
jgi:hypothetical protein